MKPEYRQMPAGGLVRIEGDDGTQFGTFMFNPRSLIAARLLDRDPTATIDVEWLRVRLGEAIAMRRRICDTPFHRLVHAEADRLPGLVIDRYDDVAVLQANTAGMDRLTPSIVEALTGLLPLRAVVARNDSAARRQEGLAENVELSFGNDAQAEVVEGGVRFAIDPLGGQKTGWFFDQRPNRDRVVALAQGARVLDVFCHIGAFGLRCAAAGAREALLVDSSAPALAQAEAIASLNGIAPSACMSGATMGSMRWQRWPANNSTWWCAIRQPLRPHARTRRLGCAPTVGWHAWQHHWWHRAASCSSPRAAIMRRWRLGARRSPSACVARVARVAFCSPAAPARTIRCIRICRRRPT